MNNLAIENKIYPLNTDSEFKIDDKKGFNTNGIIML